ncbi:hypothetical protein EJB05_53603, partial [Eragrostis curvula]
MAHDSTVAPLLASSAAPSPRRNMFPFLCAALASMTTILMSYNLTLMSGAELFTREDLDLSDTQTELLVGCGNAGSVTEASSAHVTTRNDGAGVLTREKLQVLLHGAGDLTREKLLVVLHEAGIQVTTRNEAGVLHGGAPWAPLDLQGRAGPVLLHRLICARRQLKRRCEPGMTRKKEQKWTVEEGSKILRKGANEAFKRMQRWAPTTRRIAISTTLAPQSPLVGGCGPSNRAMAHDGTVAPLLPSSAAPSPRRNMFPFLCATLASMTTILMAYNLSLMSGAELFIREDLGLSDTQTEVLVGCINVY